MKIQGFVKRMVVAVSLLSIFSSGAYASDCPSLEKLIAQARQNNPLLGAAHERVARAEAAVQEYGAKMGPKVGVTGMALWQKNDPMLPALNPFTGSITGIVPLGSRNTYAVAVSFIQTIYAGGSLYAGRQAAVLAKEAVQAEEVRVGQGVENAVRIAFYNRKRAEEKQIVAGEALKLAKNHLDRAEKFFKAGVIAKGDVLRSKVAVADAELNLIRAANAENLTLTALERAVGLPVDPAALKDSVSGRQSGGGESKPELSGDMLAIAYADRAELKMYDLLSRQAYKVARAEQGQLLPQIVAGAAVANIDDEFFPKGNEEWLVGLRVYWTLFDSGEISAKTKKAKAQAREFLCMLDDAKNTIKMEVVQAEQNLRSAESRLAVAERQVTESEEDYRIAVRRYEEQVGTNLDMLDARLSLINSKTERVDALYDIEIAKANLLYAIGK